MIYIDKDLYEYGVGRLPKRIIPPILIYVIFGGMGDCGDLKMMMI
jgi:hypothetical protein